MKTATEIRELAYRLWEERGRGEGNSEQDWLDDERRITDARSTITPPGTSNAVGTIDESLEEPFQAIDPPATRTHGGPLASTDGKWAAHRRAKASQKKPKPATLLIGGAVIEETGNQS